MSKELKKAMKDNPDLPPEFVMDVLASKLEDRELTEPFDFDCQQSAGDMLQAYVRSHYLSKLSIAAMVIEKDQWKDRKISKRKRAGLRDSLLKWAEGVGHQAFGEMLKWLEDNDPTKEIYGECSSVG